MVAESDGSATRLLGIAAALVVVLAGMKAAEEFLVPLALACFLAVLAAPAVIWLQSRRVPEMGAVLVVVVMMGGLMGGIVALVGGSINAFADAVPRYQARLDELFSSAVDLAEAQGLSLGMLRDAIQPGAAIGLAGRAVGQFASVLSNAALVMLTVVFILFEVTVIPAKLRLALGDPDADLGRFTKVVDEVNAYVVIKTYVSAATGIVAGVFVAVVGVDFPILWGLFAFLFNYVPNIGSIMAAIPPVLLALIQFGPGEAAVVAGGYTAINLVAGNVVEPRLMGNKLGLSTLIIFLSLLFWGWLWGPIGMLLSVPLTMIVKIMMEHSSQFRAVAVLMGGPPKSD
ncbi:MAG: AI-2E family transporter [Polyangiaceae bacterium]|nr:AI-2E family transporter [Polyangiaceae bacterium]